MCLSIFLSCLFGVTVEDFEIKTEFSWDLVVTQMEFADMGFGQNDGMQRKSSVSVTTESWNNLNFGCTMSLYLYAICKTLQSKDNILKLFNH